MGLKKYILGSVILVLAVFAYTFSLESGDYRVELFDYVLILPIAAWIVFPTLVLFLVTVLHIIFYGTKNYFTNKAITKDTESLTTLINKKLLNQSSSKLSFQNKSFKEIGSIVEQLDIDITNSDFSSDNKNINKAVEQILNIKAGKYISTKELKLDNDNPLMIENLKNRIEQDVEFALEVVQKPSNYPEAIVKHAFLKVLTNKSITTIKKLLDNLTFDEEMAVALLKKDGEQENQFAMTNEQVLNIIKKVNLTNTQLIEIAKNYKFLMSPDQIIKLYEDISAENEECTFAYLYILAEYEMVDKMRDILENSSPTEFTPFKALVDLKDAGKHTYSLDTICYK
jgi:hypothetical protein